MTNNIKKACFTGHRPNKCGGYKDNPIAENIKKNLKIEIEKAIADGYTHFISGGALGVDQWAAQIVLELKQQNKNLYLIIARPFPSQDLQWPNDSKKVFLKICENADLVIDVNPDPYAAWKMQARNKWMIDKSSLVIAVWDGSNGGTGNAVQYAKSKNKNIVQIKP
jgi:uncharacterized phage-like protein YoqJ